ncbi:MAG: (d)CMP kinase [Alphaproteobacteria bacterium]|nr:(d)CMP kinase [Alphaproteobacteria bacterium]
MIIAMDGPAASGKGTLAKRLAAHYGLPFLDTGLLYRAVGARVAPFEGRPGFEAEAIKAARTLDAGKIDPESIRGVGAGRLASMVGAISGVRAALFDTQRQFALQPGGAVLDGRDIGTVVCPEAEVKIFLTATLEARVARRAAQLDALNPATGVRIDTVALRAEIAARDARDRAAPHGGFRPARDAHLLDTSEMDIEAAFRAALAIVERAIADTAGGRT